MAEYHMLVIPDGDSPAFVADTFRSFHIKVVSTVGSAAPEGFVWLRNTFHSIHRHFQCADAAGRKCRQIVFGIVPLVVESSSYSLRVYINQSGHAVRIVAHGGAQPALIGW